MSMSIYYRYWCNCLLDVLVNTCLYRCITYLFLLIYSFLCFYLLRLHVRALKMNRPVINIHKVVDPWHCTMSNKLIMHKHTFSKITAWIPCYTFSETIATNWIMRLSSEQWMEQDAFSWKTIFVKKLPCMRVTCGAEWWFVMRRGKRELCRWCEDVYLLMKIKNPRGVFSFIPFPLCWLYGCH